MKPGVDFIGVSVGAVVFNNNDEVFLSKRSQNCKNERGCWEFPGGSVEFGDTMKDTIIREMQEELGVTIEVAEHLSPIDHIIPEEGQHWVTSTFIAKIIDGTPKIMEPEKCEEIGWFTLDEIKDIPISIATRISYEQLLQKNIH